MIADGKTIQVIETLKNIPINDKEVENEIVLLSSQWAEYKRLQRLDLVPASDLKNQQNNINERLLQIIDISLNNEKLDIITTRKPPIIQFIPLVILIILIVFIGLFFNYIKLPPGYDDRTEKSEVANDTFRTNVVPPTPTPIEPPKPKEPALSLQTYRLEVIDTTGKGIADVEIYCANCLVKKSKTDSNGILVLKAEFDKTSDFWMSTLSLTKNNTPPKEVTIYWREQSPQPIKLEE